MNSPASRSAQEFSSGAEDLSQVAEFIPPSWNGLRQQVLHLAQFAGDIQIIHGPKNAGKTAFISLLAEKIPADEYLGCLRLTEGIVADIALSSLLACLGMRTQPGQQKGQSVAALRKYVQALHNEKVRRIVVIDDAHLLDDSVLAAIASVLQGGIEAGFGLHLIFFAEGGLADRFDALGFIDISVHDSEIPVFSINETTEFLSQFYRASDGENYHFSPEQVHTIWSQSKGLPGNIIQLANLLREENSGHGSSASGLRIPWLHFAAISLLLGFLVWGFITGKEGEMNFTRILSGFQSFLSSSGERTAVKPEHIEPENSITDNAAVSVPQEQSNQAEDDEPSNTTHEIMPSEPQDEDLPKIALDEPKIEALEPAIGSEEVALNEVDEENAATQKEAVIREVANQNLGSTSPATGEKSADERDVLAHESSETPLISEQPEPREMSIAESTETESEKPSATPKVISTRDPLQTRPNSQVTSTQLPKTSTSVGGLSSVDAFVDASESRLLAMNPNAFALQVLAAKPDTPLREYLQTQSNISRLMMYRGLRKGKKWYVVVEGNYSSKDAAIAAIGNLPPEQVRAGPWPKQVKAIQLEILASRQQ